MTEPDQLAHWFPTTVEVDLREGGEMTFTFPDGEMEPMREAPGTGATSEWSELDEEYQRRGVPAGAPIPGG